MWTKQANISLYKHYGQYHRVQHDIRSCAHITRGYDNAGLLQRRGSELDVGARGECTDAIVL